MYPNFLRFWPKTCKRFHTWVQILLTLYSVIYNDNVRFQPRNWVLLFITSVTTSLIINLKTKNKNEKQKRLSYIYKYMWCCEGVKASSRRRWWWFMWKPRRRNRRSSSSSSSTSVVPLRASTRWPTPSLASTPCSLTSNPSPFSLGSAFSLTLL